MKHRHASFSPIQAMSRYWILAGSLVSALAASSCAISLNVDELATGAAPPDECVILMHGLARSSSSMKPMQAALLRQGYQVVNRTYPSRHEPIEDLSASHIPAVIGACRDQGAGRIHFVTHSLGGIIVRHYLQDNDIPDLGRIVMLAPPNQGSEITDTYRDAPGFSLFFGPAGAQLGTDDDSVPARLGPVDVDTAVIAGTSSINLILSLSLPNPDDGKVSVSSTRVDGMCAHLQLPIAHPFIMKDARVITEMLTYLQTGRFLSPNAEYPDCAARIQN